MTQSGHPFVRASLPHVPDRLRLVPGFQEILNVLDNTARVSGRICDETSTQLFLDRTGFYGLYRYVGHNGLRIKD